MSTCDGNIGIGHVYTDNFEFIPNQIGVLLLDTCTPISISPYTFSNDLQGFG